jgi:WhiB family redox-sensing transcriptional regulator
MPDWRHQAACRYEDPELFFPIGNTGPALLQIEDAKAVCRRCDVIDHCLQWALSSNQDAGVWGGMSEDERRTLKRKVTRDAVRYGQQIHAAAVKRYHEIRGEHLSDWAACKVVADEFGISTVQTVLAWTTASSGKNRRPGRKADPELRAHAVQLFAALRPHHSSEQAAYAAVADRVGVSAYTVGGWAREERAKTLAAAAAAKGK